MLALALSLAAVQSFSSDVIVVDALGGGDFLTIQAAVDAAQGGEVILVRHHASQAGFEVDGKSLVITSDDPDSDVELLSGVRVANVFQGQQVVLAGLSITGQLGLQPEALSIEDCHGSVRVEGCTLKGASNESEPEDCSGYAFNQGFEGARVVGSANIAFASCVITGGRGVDQAEDPLESCGFWTPGGDGGHGLDVAFSWVAAFDCSFSGGASGKGGWGGVGGDAIRSISAGQLVLSGATAVGGAGGVGFDWAFGPGGNGGAGLRTFTPTYLLGGSFQGGSGGFSFLFPDGSPGPDILGATTVWAGAPRGLQISSPATEGSTLALTFEGQPADYVLLFVSISQSFQLFAPYQGVALIGTPKALAPGVCDATGLLQLALPVPLLAPSYESQVLAAQAVFVSTAGEIVIGPFEHAVLLDAAF